MIDYSGKKKEKKNEVLDYISRLSPFSRYEVTCFEFANLALFLLWSMTCAQEFVFFFAKDVRDPGSAVSFRGLPSTVNVCLQGSALMPRLYSLEIILQGTRGGSL